MRIVAIVFALLAVGLVGGSCDGKAGSHSAGSTTMRAEHDQVHTIALPLYQADLPPGPGREAYAVACQSCHSDRYVTMQPAFSAATWEAEVRKMIKTYGAAVTEEQVPQVVQYIMATKEADAHGPWSTPVPATPDVPVPAVSIASDAPARERDLQRGQSLYAKSCASCHGPTGHGDGVGAATMLPRPTDFRSGRYAPHALAYAIVKGVTGTAMPAYPTLSRDDLRALVTVCDELSRGTSDETSAAPVSPTSPTTAPVATVDPKILYEQNCVNCHGANGGGDGIVAPTLPRWPADFRVNQPTPRRAADVIANGIPGTAMPPWAAKLSEPQRAVLADYVRSFFRPEER